MRLYYQEAYGNREVRGYVNAIEDGDYLVITDRQYKRAEKKVQTGTKPQFITEKYVRVYSEKYGCYLYTR